MRLPTNLPNDSFRQTPREKKRKYERSRVPESEPETFYYDCLEGCGAKLAGNQLEEHYRTMHNMSTPPGVKNYPQKPSKPLKQLFDQPHSKLNDLKDRLHVELNPFNGSRKELEEKVAAGDLDHDHQRSENPNGKNLNQDKEEAALLLSMLNPNSGASDTPVNMEDSLESAEKGKSIDHRRGSVNTPISPEVPAIKVSPSRQDSQTESTNPKQADQNIRKHHCTIAGCPIYRARPRDLKRHYVTKHGLAVEQAARVPYDCHICNNKIPIGQLEKHYKTIHNYSLEDGSQSNSVHKSADVHPNNKNQPIVNGPPMNSQYLHPNYDPRRMAYQLHRYQAAPSYPPYRLPDQQARLPNQQFLPAHPNLRPQAIGVNPAIVPGAPISYHKQNSIEMGSVDSRVARSKRHLSNVDPASSNRSGSFNLHQPMTLPPIKTDSVTPSFLDSADFVQSPESEAPPSPPPVKKRLRELIRSRIMVKRPRVALKATFQCENCQHCQIMDNSLGMELTDKNIGQVSEEVRQCEKCKTFTYWTLESFSMTRVIANEDETRVEEYRSEFELLSSKIEDCIKKHPTDANEFTELRSKVTYAQSIYNRISDLSRKPGMPVLEELESFSGIDLTIMTVDLQISDFASISEEFRHIADTKPSQETLNALENLLERIGATLNSMEEIQVRLEKAFVKLRDAMNVMLANLNKYIEGKRIQFQSAQQPVPDVFEKFITEDCIIERSEQMVVYLKLDPERRLSTIVTMIKSMRAMGGTSQQIASLVVALNLIPDEANHLTKVLAESFWTLASFPVNATDTKSEELKISLLVKGMELEQFFRQIEYHSKQLAGKYAKYSELQKWCQNANRIVGEVIPKPAVTSEQDLFEITRTDFDIEAAGPTIQECHRLFMNVNQFDSVQDILESLNRSYENVKAKMHSVEDSLLRLENSSKLCKKAMSEILGRLTSFFGGDLKKIHTANINSAAVGSVSNFLTDLKAYLDKEGIEIAMI